MGELLGIVVADRYELTGILGHGGQGVVYRARDRTAGRDVAIKMLSDTVADDPVYAARLAREQEALVALAGTSAVAVYDLCEAPNGSLCLVMELLEGTDLESHLAELESRSEHMPLPRMSSIIAPIVETLERAHDVGIIHRDLKPANIFILRDNQGVRLFDFGLSRSKKAVRLTQAGTVMGSPSYIAPEVWKGDSDALDGRVDVYSLGVIIFRCLSGRLPFEGRTLKESFELASKAERPSLRALRPDLSPRVDAWVAQALAIDRDRRYQTARGLWTGLLKALEYHPPPETIRPVAEGLVSAWRAASGAFRKLVDRATAAIPAPRPPTSPPESLRPNAALVAAVDEGWVELTDADVLKSTLHKPAGKTRTAPPPRRRSTAAPPGDARPSTPQATPATSTAPAEGVTATSAAPAESATATTIAPAETPATPVTSTPSPEVAPAPAETKASGQPAPTETKESPPPAAAPEPSSADEHPEDSVGDRPSFFSTAAEVQQYLTTSGDAPASRAPGPSKHGSKAEASGTVAKEAGRGARGKQDRKQKSRGKKPKKSAKKK